MNKIKILSYMLLMFLFIQCGKDKKKSLVANPINHFNKKKKLTKEGIRSWYLKDIELDTVPGISLNRVYDSLLVNKKGREIIIAVLDSEIDFNHKKIQKYIWKNLKEIPENNIDDDGNGYIDDVEGWNFLGNQRGGNADFTSYAYTRILKKYDSIFKNKRNIDIKSKDSLLFLTYSRAKEKYNDQCTYAKEDIEYANMLLTSMSNAKKVLSKYFLNENYTLKDLDSLKKKFPNKKILQKQIIRRSNFMKYGFSQEYMNSYKLKAKERIQKLLNLDYNDRLIQGDNAENITDINYGNNIINRSIASFTHGTEIAGTIVSVNSDIKIMPVIISPYGDEYDKDIALAIRYAVDNGAKVINMSFGKEFSLHAEWVFDAFKYAEKNNVLIISSSGNNKFNLNVINDYYPNDNLENGPEVSNNFLLVGASSRRLSKKLIYRNSNYGNIDVDLFAPGKDIYTTIPNNKYKFDSGTSLSSAITTGVAGLLFSYYPNLTASQVKHILMDSGLEYTIEVSTPTKEDKNKKTPFNKLSKSGKVLNAYNALIMADSISRN